MVFFYATVRKHKQQLILFRYIIYFYNIYNRLIINFRFSIRKRVLLFLPQKNYIIFDIRDPYNLLLFLFLSVISVVIRESYVYLTWVCMKRCAINDLQQQQQQQRINYKSRVVSQSAAKVFSFFLFRVKKKKND